MSSLVVWYPGWVWARGRSVWWLLNFRVDYTLALWCINILVRIHVVWWPGWLGSRVGGTWICTRWQWWQPHKPHATVAPPPSTNTNTNTNTNTDAQKRAVALSPPTTAEEAGDPGWYVLTQRLRHLGWKWIPSCDITRAPVTPWCQCWALYNPQTTTHPPLLTGIGGRPPLPSGLC